MRYVREEKNNIYPCPLGVYLGVDFGVARAGRGGVTIIENIIRQRFWMLGNVKWHSKERKRKQSRVMGTGLPRGKEAGCSTNQA